MTTWSKCAPRLYQGWWTGPDLGKDSGMARTIWKGSLSFGLVNVPVGVYSATDDKTIHFNQLERGTSDRVRNKRVNERTGEEVAYDAIVKGFDLGGGRYVIVEPEELESVEPGRSRTIDITDYNQVNPNNGNDVLETIYKSVQAVNGGNGTMTGGR